MTTSEFTDPETAKPEYARLHLGTAPDSWGIWFPDDPKQPHWSTFLDEVAECGFRTIELGPFGYLPTHPEQLKDELGKRGLSLTGGTVGTATHRGAEAYEQGRRDAFAVCELLAAMDVHHLVVLPEMYTDSAKTLGFRGFVAESGPLTSRLDLVIRLADGSVSYSWRILAPSVGQDDVGNIRPRPSPSRISWTCRGSPKSRGWPQTMTRQVGRRSLRQWR